VYLTKEMLVGSNICGSQMAALYEAPLNNVCTRYEINTALRVAGFLSQIAHESGGFTATVENLYYQASALNRSWPQLFPADVAQQYAMQPERIANRAYGNRMGNGDEASGDGWKYRGRGLIQLTGKENYLNFAMSADVDTLVHPELVELPELAALSAGWFWHTNDLNTLADLGYVEAMTRRINGGLNGLADRQAKYTTVLKVLAWE
jgi:putative chitinase